jgi:hypothetical protein
MIDEELAKTFVFRNKRLKNLWEIGPVHKCSILELIDGIILHINNEYDSDNFQDFLVRNKLYTLYKQRV